ncbi:hypothetical protein ACFYOY_32995 [Streptomyces sp. NPDC007875]|uniref:hypothetical protein n=1 Tax=Streptomyces sp. NPDC007875 TaxID=3364783 RepID=UPI0036861F7F
MTVVMLGIGIEDLKDAGSRAKLLIRDRDSKFTTAFNALMSDKPLHAAHYPHPSRDKPSSPTSKSADETDSAEPSTNTDERSELPG